MAAAAIDVRHPICGLLVLLLLSCSISRSAAANSTCGQLCQEAQAAALLQLYTQTSARSWNVSRGWSVQSSARPDVPSHCDWFGVACCIGGQVDLRDFPSTLAVSCEVLSGVTAVLLPSNNLFGPLSGIDWEAFAPSLQYLDLSGAGAAVEPILLKASSGTSA